MFLVCDWPGLEAGDVISGVDGAKAVVVGTRVMQGTPREPWMEMQMQVQIENGIAKKIGDAFLRTRHSDWPRILDVAFDD